VEPPWQSYESLCPGPPRIATDLDSLGPSALSMTLHFCAMLILCCNDALLGRRSYREVETHGQGSRVNPARGHGAIVAKRTRPGGKDVGTGIVGSQQTELAERTEVHQEPPDEGESDTFGGPQRGAPQRV
jgi:hypothetical protein